MSLGAILGQMLQQGMAGPAQGRMRQGAGAASGGAEDILGALLGGGGQSGAAQGAGGLGDLLGAVLGGAQGGAQGGMQGGGRGASGIDAMGSLGRTR